MVTKVNDLAAQYDAFLARSAPVCAEVRALETQRAAAAEAARLQRLRDQEAAAAALQQQRLDAERARAEEAERRKEEVRVGWVDTGRAPGKAVTGDGSLDLRNYSPSCVHACAWVP